MGTNAPAEPTPEQCSANERVVIPGSDTPAYAVWWPQMGGHHGVAVITAGDCPDVWVWHDGSFPFHGHWDKPGQSPTHLQLSDSDQWIDLFEQQKVWAAEWRGDDEDEYSPQAQPTADDLVRAGVDLAPYAKPPAWEPEDPLLVQLHDARLDRFDRAPLTADDRARLAAGETITVDLAQRRQDALADLVVSALHRSPLADLDPQMPVVVRLPDGVTAEKAMEWIRGCERLGILEPSPNGHLFLPPGVL